MEASYKTSTITTLHFTEEEVRLLSGLVQNQVHAGESADVARFREQLFNLLNPPRVIE